MCWALPNVRSIRNGTLLLVELYLIVNGMKTDMAYDSYCSGREKQ